MSEKKLLVLGQIHDDCVDGSTQVTASCGHECWLAPGSQTIFNDPDTETKCVECFGGYGAIAEGILAGKAVSPDVDELRREIKKMFGVDL
jgi:hypothetical protein